MNMPDEDVELGMDRPIARRDFLNGMAIGITSASAILGHASKGEAQTPPAAQATKYPPGRSGLRGNIPSAIAEFDHLREGKYAAVSLPDQEIHEEYDLVIVGAGISGLSAAHLYRTALGPEQRILILDNHDDFGGHAKRNEFYYQGRTFIGYGGTMAIAMICAPADGKIAPSIAAATRSDGAFCSLSKGSTTR